MTPPAPATRRSLLRPAVWLFDLDDTLHDATSAAYAGINEGMTSYIVHELGYSRAEADALRRRYWVRYGATLLGLVRHHGVKPAHFLHHAHVLPGLEQRVRGQVHDLFALARLPGRRVLLTNAPAAYTARVLGVLGIGGLFERIVSIEGMRMFGELRPKPDARMLRWLAARLGVPPAHCTLVEDTLVHQKSARRIGMGTVWMQRWLRHPRDRRHGKHGKPAYVDRRVRALGRLRRG
jgi:putative hydrolase of the HAD superfamily